VNKLHTIVSEDTFLAARNAVMDCDFPNGDCENAGDVSETSASFPAFPAFISGDYYFNQQFDSTCSGEFSFSLRLCYCKAP
jgi:hypothetical protein